MELEFWEACKEGDLPQVKKLLEAHPDLDVNWQNSDFFDYHSLSVSARENKLDVVTFLLENTNAHIDLSNSRGFFPFFVAWFNGRDKSMELIRNHKRKVLGITPEEEVKKTVDLLKHGQAVIKTLGYFNEILADTDTRQLALNSNVIELFSHFFIPQASASIINACFWSFQPLTDVSIIRTTFARNNGYSSLFQAYLEKNSMNKQMIVPAWKLLNQGKEVWDSVVSRIPDIFSRLHLICRGESVFWIKLYQAGLILMLSGFFPKEKSITKEAYTLIANAISNTHDFVGFGLSQLLMAAVPDASRPVLVGLGVRELVGRFLLKPKSESGLISCVILALLSANDSQESKSEVSPVEAIDEIMRLTKEFSERAIAEIPLTEETLMMCDTTLVALRSLATNEMNLKSLKEKGVVNVMIAFFKNRKKNIEEENQSFLEEAARVIWTLAFDPELREDLIAHGIVEILNSFTKAEGDSKKAIDGALWTLKKREEKVISVSVQPSSSAGHVMISYSWSQKERMRELAFLLKESGFNIWLDVEQMEGSILEKMSEAIEEASVVVVGLSAAYKESQACRTEAEYAYRLKKDVIYVMAEDGFTPKGWLGAMVANSLYYSPWTHEGGLSDGSSEIIKRINKALHASGGSASISQQASAAPASGPRAPPELTSAPSHSKLLPQASMANLYSQVKLPENQEPLPEGELSLDKLSSWGTEETCRWLGMVHLEGLRAPIVWHKIDGKALLRLARLEEGAFFEVWKHLQVAEVGLGLQLRHALEGLHPGKQIRGWGNEQVAIWLEERQLEGVAAVARVQGWNGAALHGLSRLTHTPSFLPFLQGLQISDHSTQLVLLSELEGLFAK